MSKRVFSIAPDETIHSALMLMSSNKVSRVIVTKNNKHTGIITGDDLLPISTPFHHSFWPTLCNHYIPSTQTYYKKFLDNRIGTFES
jgi:signal-transduction protein with cAMP-binding, CBS, and nucleotidyltransferase domain